jgi:Rieske 2Fe-2S family protein
VNRPAATADARATPTPTYLLPPSAYSSPTWFEQERAALFTRRWALVASEDQLTEPGSYVVATIGTAPVVVICGEDGRLRAFHNLCRHRGMMLLQGTGRVQQRIRCFYHQWRYDLDGALAVVPQRAEQFPDLVTAEWGLLPASLEVWEGMVFVHPDPAAEPLAGTLDGLPGHIGSFRPGLLAQVALVRLEARCNWKLLVENHIDVYHLWYLHASTLGDFDHARFEHRQVGRNWVSYEPIRRDGLEGGALTSGTATIAHLSGRDRMGIGAHQVFPNLLMATAAEFFATYVAEPVAPDRTVVELRIRAERGADGTKLLAAVQSFIAEDIGACEAVQAGIASPAFSVGPLARDHEAPIYAFQTHVLDAMGSAR